MLITLLLLATSSLVAATPLQSLTLYLPLAQMNSSTVAANSKSIEAWADAARHGLDRPNPDQQHAIDTLEAMFYGKMGPRNVAFTMAAIYNPLLQRGFQTCPVFELWGMVCIAAQMLGSNHDIDGKLIDLVDALSRLPNVNDQSGNPIGPGGGFRGVYWKDLPVLAIMLREYAFDIEPGTPELPDEGDWTDAQRATQMNVVTFGALYLVDGVKDIGMAFQAEISLRDGLEEPYDTIVQQRRAKTLVPPAAKWIELAGQQIYNLCMAGKLPSGRPCNMGQWTSWKRAFHEININSALTSDVRSIAGQAAFTMSMIRA